MRISWNGFKTRRSLSPVTIHAACPERAHSKTTLSFGSRQASMRCVGRTIVARYLSNLNSSFISEGSRPREGRIRTSANSERSDFEQTSSNLHSLNASYILEETPFPKRAETKTFASRTTRGTGMPVFSYVFDDTIDFSNRNFFDSAPPTDAFDHLIQPSRPCIALKFTDKLELLTERQFFNDRANVHGNCDFHTGSIPDGMMTINASRHVVGEWGR